jgi:tetratricopeptide (TPR) repeat protein
MVQLREVTYEAKALLPRVVFTAILLSLTPGESTLIAAAKPLQENWEVYLKRGYEHYPAQRYTEALGAYSEAVPLKPDYSKAHFSLINTYSKLNRSEEAVALYRQAVATRPNDAVAHYGLGLSYGLSKLQKEPGPAVAAYEQVIRLKPDFAEAHNNLGGQ